MTRRTRRAALAAAGAALAGPLAGCSALFGERRGGGTATGSGDDPTRVTDRARTGTATSLDPPTTRVPGGTYTVGADDGPADARPAHEVTVGAFRIDTYEVTNAAFAAFLNGLDADVRGSAAPGEATAANFGSGDADRFTEGAEGEEERPLVALDDGNARIGIEEGRFVVESGYADHPVNEVTWDGARAFADRRGARLPTEAEWEAAARGTAGRTYPWGEADPTAERAVFGRGSGETAPVGTHPAGATPAGVHDMAGNVSEWTSSLYRPYPYDADDGREDPTVAGERVTRGGAHVFFSAAELAAYYRTGFSREFDRGHRHIGFRCAESVGGDG